MTIKKSVRPGYTGTKVEITRFRVLLCSHSRLNEISNDDAEKTVKKIIKVKSLLIDRSKSILIL